MTTRIKLHFNDPKINNPTAYLYLGNHSVKSGRHLLSYDLCGEGELEEYIDFLIYELQQIRKEGKKKFQQSKTQKL